MAKITISQLNTADAASIQELTTAELDATKGGLDFIIAPVINLKDTAFLGKTNTNRSTNNTLNSIGQSLLGLVA